MKFADFSSYNIDLNGYELTRYTYENDSKMFDVSVKVNLEIRDTSEDKTGSIQFNVHNAIYTNYTFCVEGSSKLVVSDIEISNESGGGIYNYDSSTGINNVRLYNDSCEGIVVGGVDSSFSAVSSEIRTGSSKDDNSYRIGLLAHTGRILVQDTTFYGNYDREIATFETDDFIIDKCSFIRDTIRSYPQPILSLPTEKNNNGYISECKIIEYPNRSRQIFHGWLPDETIVTINGKVVDKSVYNLYTIDGVPANVYGIKSIEDEKTTLVIKNPQKIQALVVNDVDFPVHGQKPDKEVKVSIAPRTEPAVYEGLVIKDVRWKDVATGKYLGNSDTFVSGKSYEMSVLADAAFGYEFDTSACSRHCFVNVNGTYKKVNPGWAGTDAYVYICYTFIAEAEHIHSYTGGFKSDDEYHWLECSCGNKKNITAHSWSNWQASETTGKEQRSCIICGRKQERNLFLLGDVNDDGKIDINDVTKIQRYLAKFETFSSTQQLAGDVDGDGKISILDATLLQKYIAEEITET